MQTDTPKIEELVKKNGTVEGSLIGVDGNALSIMGYVERKLKRGGWPREDVKQVMNLMMSGDYNNVIATGCAVLS